MTAGKLMSYGRRNSLFVIGVSYIIAGALTQIMNFWCIAVARTFAGFGTGATLAVASRIIEEYVPLAMYSTAAPFNLSLIHI